MRVVNIGLRVFTMLLLLLSVSLASAQRLTDAEELAFKDNVEDLCRGRYDIPFLLLGRYGIPGMSGLQLIFLDQNLFLSLSLHPLLSKI